MPSRGQKAAATRRANAKHQEQMRRLNAILKRLPAEVRANVRKEIGAAAEAIKADARSRVPVLTGNLRKTIGWRYGDTTKIPHSQGNVGGDSDLSAVVFAGDDFARYAHLVEYGTQSAPAQPFFRPAIRGNRKQIDAAMNGALKRAIRDARKAK